MSAPQSAELPRPFDIVSLPESGRAIEIGANSAERDAIARRLGLLQLREFAVTGRLSPERRGRSAVFEARLQARVIQECIVTGEPVEAAIDEEWRVRLLTEAAADTRTEVEIEADEDDVEIAEAGIVDLGDICVQYLALALDPYPRAPGAADVVPLESDANDGSSAQNPFAVLKKLKDKT